MRQTDLILFLHQTVPKIHHFILVVTKISFLGEKNRNKGDGLIAFAQVKQSSAEAIVYIIVL